MEDTKPPTAIPETKLVACFQRGMFAKAFNAARETLRGGNMRFAELAFEAGVNACTALGS
eukprot:scaffold1332_cov166-Amphora_coffeaeformis.AAC.20